MKTLNERIVQCLEKEKTPQVANMIANVLNERTDVVTVALDKLGDLGIVKSALVDGRIRWSIPEKEQIRSSLPHPVPEHTHSTEAKQPKVEIKIEVEQRRSIPGIGLQTRRDLVLETLQNSTQPLSCIDIASQAKLKVQGVACVLTKLKNQGLVVNENGCWQITGKNSGVVIPEPIVTKKNQIEWTSKTALTPPKAVAADSSTPLWAAEKIMEAISPTLEPKFGYFSDGSFLIQSANQTMILNPEHVGSLFNFVKKCQLEVSV